MKPKFLPILAIALLISCFANAQRYDYEYDDAGNRVKRYYTTTQQGSPPAPEPPAEDSLFMQGVEFPELTGQNIDKGNELEHPDEEEEEPFRMILYPNPTTGYFTLELPDLPQGAIGDITIVSQMGLLVYSQNKLSEIQSINIANAPVGLCLIRITADDKLYVVSIIKD